MKLNVREKRLKYSAWLSQVVADLNIKKSTANEMVRKHKYRKLL